MPYSSDKQRRFFHTKAAKKAGITDKEVHEFDEASKGMSLPEAIRHKRSHEERVKLWRGGEAHAVLKDKEHLDADAMPEDREEQLARYGKMEHNKPSDLDMYLKHMMSDGGEVMDDYVEKETDTIPSREEELDHIDDLIEEDPYKADKKEHYATGGMVSGPSMESQQQKLHKFTMALKRKRS